MEITFKITSWGVIDLEQLEDIDAQAAQEVVDKIRNGELETSSEVHQYLVDLGHDVDYSLMTSKEEDMTLEENNMESTVEIDTFEPGYHGPVRTNVWNNGIPEEGEIPNADKFSEAVMKQFLQGDFNKFLRKYAKKAYLSGMLDTTQMDYSKLGQFNAVIKAALSTYSSEMALTKEGKSIAKDLKHL